MFGQFFKTFTAERNGQLPNNLCLNNGDCVMWLRGAEIILYISLQAYSKALHKCLCGYKELVHSATYPIHLVMAVECLESSQVLLEPISNHLCTIGRDIILLEQNIIPGKHVKYKECK